MYLFLIKCSLLELYRGISSVSHFLLIIFTMLDNLMCREVYIIQQYIKILNTFFIKVRSTHSE